MFEDVNLEKALKKERSKKRKWSDDLLREVNNLFSSEWEVEQRISAQIGKSNEELQDLTELEWDEDRMYTSETIRSLCVKYRLRFLDSALFQGEIPYEAIRKIKSLEEEKDVSIRNFKIMAPSKLFKLQDAKEDPLLFAEVGKDKFYLVHKWGNDMSWYRKLLSWPLRNVTNLFAMTAIIAGVLSMMVPNGWLTHFETAPFFNGFRILFFVWTTVFLSGILSYLWFASNQEFSSAQWNSKYFND